MRRKAFWGDSGGTMRQVPSLVNGEMVNFGVNAYGVQFERRDNGQLSRLIPWNELHRLAQHNPLEQLGAAVAERSEPEDYAQLLIGKQRKNNPDDATEPRILPVEDK